MYSAHSSPTPSCLSPFSSPSRLFNNFPLLLPLGVCARRVQFPASLSLLLRVCVSFSFFCAHSLPFSCLSPGALKTSEKGKYDQGKILNQKRQNQKTRRPRENLARAAAAVGTRPKNRPTKVSKLLGQAVRLLVFDLVDSGTKVTAVPKPPATSTPPSALQPRDIVGFSTPPPPFGDPSLRRLTSPPLRPARPRPRPPRRPRRYSYRIRRLFPQVPLLSPASSRTIGRP